MLALLALLGAEDPAAAQGARQMVPGALTTRRLERLLEAYVRPTPDEASAIDRLHERYLERFRLELEPEIGALSSSMSTGMPSREQFDRFMRDLDRVSTRVAEADGAFIDACAGVVAEGRRGGLQRIREARERQRVLSGFGAIGGMMFGVSIGFVDAADMLARPEFLRAVPADARERLDAVLRAQEPRVLSQARSYAKELGDGMGGFFDAMASSFGANGAPDPAAQQAFRETIAETGARLRRLLRQNFERNREMAGQLAGILPEPQLLEFRQRVALRTFGPMAAAFTYGAESDVGAVGSRIARDRSAPPAMKAEVDAIVQSWKREWTAALEKSLADLAADESVASPFDGMEGGTPATRAVEELAATRARLARAAFERMSAVLGDRASDYITRIDGPSPDGEATETTYQAAVKPQAEPDADQAEFDAATVRSGALAVGATLEALLAREVFAVLETAGTPGLEQAVVEALVEEWTESDWKANVQPIRAEFEKALASLYVQTAEGGYAQDAAARQRIADRRRELGVAALESDARLIAQVSGALGLAADDPAPVLLRLERMNMLMNRWVGMTDLGFPLPPAQLLRNARVDPATARAVAIAALPQLKAIADDMPALLARRLERAARIAEVESAFATRDQAAIEQSSREYPKLLQEGQREDEDFSRSFAAIYDKACAAVVSDAEQLAELRRARLRATYPSVYRVADSALREFAAAARLEGLTDDERTRLEVMRAEYEGVYEALSEQMVMPAFDVASGDGSAESWQEYARRAEEVEKRRFQRNERTEKARNELRRLLGDERAARVPGLVRDPTDERPRDEARYDPFNPFGDD